MRNALAVALVLAAPAAWADQVFLAGGGVVNGEVVSQTATALVVEVGPGRMTLPMARVARVVSSKSDLTVYRERAGMLAPDDVAGWLALARFAESRELLTQAREAYQRVLAFDPGSAAANAAVGRVHVNGHWMSRDDAARSRGMIPFEGDWVTPEQHAAILAERVASARAREAALEAEARAREAEARVRIAEAEARRAEADASAGDSGVPYPYVYGGGYGYGTGYGAGYGVGYGGYVGGYPPVYDGVWVGTPQPPIHGGAVGPGHGFGGGRGGRNHGGRSHNPPRDHGAVRQGAVRPVPAPQIR